MQYMTIGKSDIAVSRIALGTWAVGGDAFWGKGDDSQAQQTIHSAIDHGITLIDTAPAYGFGHSETIVGKALQGIRDKVVISTKCGLRWDSPEGTLHAARDGANVMRNVTADSIRYEVEQSLRRLQTDYIDIYLTHWQSVEPVMTPVAETMGALMDLKKEGKIRAIGASNVSPWHLDEYIKYGQLDIIQEKYSMLDRRVETELLPLCRQHGITFQAYSPLEQGVLTGKYGRNYQPQVESGRYQKPWFAPKNINQVADMLDGWQDLCEKYNCSPAHLAIAWTAAQWDNINVLCGARKAEHLQDNAKALDFSLSQQEITKMRHDVEKIYLHEKQK